MRTLCGNAALAATLLALAGCSSARSTAATTTTTAATTVTTAAGPTNPAVRCPLTGVPAPNGVIPNHPAVAVKVENLPNARPQYGLQSADLVYEEPVEGGITRFLAVFQCHQVGRIEPVRSARLVDAEILPQLSNPVFGFAGGIDPSVSAVEAADSRIVDDITDAAPYSLDPRRYGPHNLEVSTTSLLAAAGHPKGPPKAVFTYTTSTPAGTSAASVHLDISISSDVYWRWDRATGRYKRYYGTSPAMLGNGTQIQAANLVVERVVVRPSPYVEDATGVHESYVDLNGSGAAEVARGGVVIKGRWVHPSTSPTSPTELLDSAGNRIPLAPGPTWIELLPTTSGASPTP